MRKSLLYQTLEYQEFTGKPRPGFPRLSRRAAQGLLFTHSPPCCCPVAAVTTGKHYNHPGPNAIPGHSHSANSLRTKSMPGAVLVLGKTTVIKTQQILISRDLCPTTQRRPPNATLFYLHQSN